MRIRNLLFAFLLICVVLGATPVYAACSNPVGEEGQVVYNTSYDTVQYCNGTNWYSMKGCSSSGNIDLTGCTDGNIPTYDQSSGNLICGSGSGGNVLSTTVWNSSDKGANVILSNGNLTAAMNGVTQGVRATTGVSAGKYYWEIKHDSVAANIMVGIANASQSLNTWFGSSLNSVAMQLTNGMVYKNSSVQTTYNGSSQNDIIMVAVDLTNNMIFFGENGTWHGSSDPATGTNPAATFTAGIWYPAYSDSGGAGNTQVTARFSESQWSYSAPAGYGMVSESSACASGSQTYTASGTYPLTIPTKCGSVTVKLWGAGGGSGSDGPSGGWGAYVTGQLNGVAGKTIEVKVGGAGAVGSGGFNGGASGGSGAASRVAGGGGGATTLSIDGTYVAAAGGGGGGGAYNDGGHSGSTDTVSVGSFTLSGGGGSNGSGDQFNGCNAGGGGGGGGGSGGQSGSCNNGNPDGDEGGGAGKSIIPSGGSATALNTSDANYNGTAGKTAQPGMVHISW